MADEKKTGAGYSADVQGEEDLEEHGESFRSKYQADPLTKGYADDEPDEAELERETEQESVEGEDEYEFLDEGEVSELELEEHEPVANGSLMEQIRSKIQPLIGEENFDRLKGMAIPIVVVAIFVIFGVSKLSSLFATPGPNQAKQISGAQTQFTQIESPRKLVTTDIVRPGDEHKGPQADAAGAQPGQMVAGQIPSATGQPGQPGQMGLPGQPGQMGLPGQPAGMVGVGAGPNDIPQGLAASAQPGMLVPGTNPAAQNEATAGQMSAFPMQPGNPNLQAAQTTQPGSSSSIASGLKSLLGGGANAPQQGQPMQPPPGGFAEFQLQPGAPGYTTAVPTGSMAGGAGAWPEVSDAVLRTVQKDQEKLAAKFNQQLSSLDDQTKGLDDRLLRLEKMQDDISSKMTNINSQLENVGKTMATLNKSLKEKSKRSQFVYHGEPQGGQAAGAAHPGGGHRAFAPTFQPAGVKGYSEGFSGGQPVAPGVQFETPSYHVEAVVPGRAWLKDQNGTTITVGKGDQIRGYGYVTYIDSENGLVVTSSGIVVRYGIDTR